MRPANWCAIIKSLNLAGRAQKVVHESQSESHATTVACSQAPITSVICVPSPLGDDQDLPLPAHPSDPKGTPRPPCPLQAELQSHIGPRPCGAPDWCEADSPTHGTVAACATPQGPGCAKRSAMLSALHFLEVTCHAALLGRFTLISPIKALRRIQQPVAHALTSVAWPGATQVHDPLTSHCSLVHCPTSTATT